MNSLKSACSFAKRAPVPLHELEQNVEPLLGREVRVEPVVGLIGLVKTAEDPSDAIHE